MTIEQKVGQMTQVAVDDLEDEFDPDDPFATHDETDTVGELFTELHVGSILNGGASGPTWDGEEFVEGLNGRFRSAPTGRTATTTRRRRYRSTRPPRSPTPSRCPDGTTSTTTATRTSTT